MTNEMGHLPFLHGVASSENRNVPSCRLARPGCSIAFHIAPSMVQHAPTIDDVKLLFGQTEYSVLTMRALLKRFWPDNQNYDCREGNILTGHSNSSQNQKGSDSLHGNWAVHCRS